VGSDIRHGSHHIGDRLDLAFEDLGDQNLKNIARPVRIYRVRAAEHRNRRFID